MADLDKEALQRAAGYIAFVIVVILTVALYFHDQDANREKRCKESRQDTRTAIIATVLYAFEQSPAEGAEEVAENQQFVSGLKDLLEDILPDSGCE